MGPCTVWIEVLPQFFTDFSIKTMVIQRWQSVLLLIAAVVMGCFTFMSLGQVQLPDYTCNFTTLGFDIEGIATDGGPTGFVAHTWIFFAVSMLSFIMPFIAIFCFRNMRLQKLLCLIEILFLVAVICIGAVYGYYSFPQAAVSWSSLIIAPFLAIVADVMAYNRICADGRKLRAADRLR